MQLSDTRDRIFFLFPPSRVSLVSPPVRFFISSSRVLSSLPVCLFPLRFLLLTVVFLFSVCFLTCMCSFAFFDVSLLCLCSSRVPLFLLSCHGPLSCMSAPRVAASRAARPASQ